MKQEKILATSTELEGQNIDTECKTLDDLLNDKLVFDNWIQKNIEYNKNKYNIELIAFNLMENKIIPKNIHISHENYLKEAKWWVGTKVNKHYTGMFCMGDKSARAMICGIYIGLYSLNYDQKQWKETKNYLSDKIKEPPPIMIKEGIKPRKPFDY